MNDVSEVTLTVTTRSILRRYMADYSVTNSYRGKVAYGFFAIHAVKTGKVWLGETQNFEQVLSRWKTGKQFSNEVEEARANGSRLELWFLTQPQRFSAAALEKELWDLDRLMGRKERTLTGPGTLYSVRHIKSNDYFVITDRAGIIPTTLLHNFLIRLQKVKGNATNKHLAKFISDQAVDILRGLNFTINPIAIFTDTNDCNVKRNKYISECTIGKNLNWRDVDKLKES